MIIEQEIKKLVSYKEQVLNRYSDRAQVAMKYEIKILKQTLAEIDSYERKIKHYEKYDKQIKEENNKLSLENEELKLKEGDLFFESTIKQKNKYIKQLETENENLSKKIDELKRHNGDLFFENWKLQEEVEHGRFYTEDNIMLKDSMRSNLELLHINAHLTAQIEELKIHIRSLLYEGKQYDNVGG